MLRIPAFAGMTEETDGLDESSPYIYIDRRDASLIIVSCSSFCFLSPSFFVLYYILNTKYYILIRILVASSGEVVLI